MATIPRVIEAIEILTGLEIVVDHTKKTLQVWEKGNQGFGCVYQNDTELLKELYRILVNDSRKQLALFRVIDAVDKEQPWTELFMIATDEVGWDHQELVSLAGIPSAFNIHTVTKPHLHLVRKEKE